MTVEADKIKIKLGEIYVILGNDSYSIDQTINKIKTKLTEAHEAETITLWGNETKAGPLSDVLDSFSLFASSKLVIIKNAEGLDAKTLEVLVKYLDSEQPDQSLILTSEKVDGKLGAWKKLKDRSQFISFEKPRFAGQLKEWVNSQIKVYGKQFSPRALDEFVNRVELDYALADNELRKLVLMTDSRKSITETDVERSMGTSRAGTIIDLHRALGKRNLQSSLAQIQSMLENDFEPNQVFFHFRKLFLTIWRIRLLKEKHISDSEIISSHLADHFPSQRKEFVTFAANYSGNALVQVFKILLETDIQFKSANTDLVILLYLATGKILACK